MSDDNLFIDVEKLQPAVLFAEGGASGIVFAVEKTVRAIETDISTAKGRGEIASIARRVSSTKARLDDMGKAYVADLKQKAKVVDTERATIRDRLDKLRDEVRGPLTAWEEKQKARLEEHEAALAELQALPIFAEIEPSAADIRDRLDRARAIHGNRDWEEFENRAAKARAEAMEKMGSMLAAAERREADRAELERLKREQAEREQAERDARIAKLAAEAAQRDAEEKAAREKAEAEAHARAEQERIEREKREAEERAERAEREKREAEERAERQRKENEERAERARQEAEEQARRAAEHATEVERQRVAAEKAAEEEAARKREANKRHRAKINNAALQALTKLGLDESQALAVVKAIAAGDIPNVSIAY